LVGRSLEDHRYLPGSSKTIGGKVLHAFNKPVKKLTPKLKEEILIRLPSFLILGDFTNQTFNLMLNFDDRVDIVNF
jgi:hypothetical protein